MKSLLSLICFLVFCGKGWSGEEPFLQNIRQLTFSSMGFEKAGEAYFSPDGQSIIFQAAASKESGYQMYVMSLEEGLPKMVSTGKGTCTCGYFSPCGKKILFASSHEAEEEYAPEPPRSGQYKWDLTPYMNVYQADLDGSGLLRLTSGPAYHAECAYSPDGTQIVYASNEEGSMNLYVMDADGSHVKRLTHTTYCYNGGPFFSPDGKKIVFRADRDKENELQVYVMDSDGSNEKQITFQEAVNWAPFWHPNGNLIAYTTSLHGHYRYEIYLINIQTDVQVRLTDNPSFDGLPSFNKEGDRMLWTSRRGDDGSCQIFVADFVIPEELQ